MKYKVLSRLKHNGKLYKPGDEIEVKDDRKFKAKELIDSGVIKKTPKK